MGIKRCHGIKGLGMRRMDMFNLGAYEYVVDTCLSSLFLFFMLSLSVMTVLIPPLSFYPKDCTN